jgi:hypothetical protein
MMLLKDVLKYSSIKILHLAFDIPLWFLSFVFKPTNYVFLIYCLYSEYQSLKATTPKL